MGSYFLEFRGISRFSFDGLSEVASQCPPDWFQVFSLSGIHKQDVLTVRIILVISGYVFFTGIALSCSNNTDYLSYIWLCVLLGYCSK